MLEGASLIEIEYLSENDIHLKGMLKRLTTKTYPQFLESLYDDLCRVLDKLEDNCQQYPDDESEDATTQRIVDMLSVMGYEAHHNATSGGNVDLTVEKNSKQWKWIAEAKRYKSIADVREGYLQLASRYRPGVPDRDRAYGGLIGYLRRPNPLPLITDWKNEVLQTSEASGASIGACNRRGPRAFYSEHQHSVYGVPFQVWHVCVCLHFLPTDKSGRTAKKYKTQQK